MPLTDRARVVVCVTCVNAAVELPPDIGEIDLAVAMVEAGWRRVVGGWRCAGCIAEEEAGE